MKDWKVIISSLSGGGKARKEWPAVARLLKKKGISFSESFTDHQYHAIELAREAVLAGYRKIMAVGGDGAIHEILNGIFQQSEVPTEEITLAIIPVGSGNDWSRLHEIPKSHEKAVEVIARNKVVSQDVARVDSVMDGQPYCRYMMNIGGLGFDAQVCHDYDIAKSKGRTGDVQYFSCLMKGFIWYRNRNFTIYADDELFYEGPALSVALGIGKYCGGGMMQTPGAVFDDGLIDITVTGRLSKLKFIGKVKDLYKGTIYNLKEVVHTRARQYRILSKPDCYVEVDGEAVGFSPITVQVVPAAVKVVTNID